MLTDRFRSGKRGPALRLRFSVWREPVAEYQVFRPGPMGNKADFPQFRPVPLPEQDAVAVRGRPQGQQAHIRQGVQDGVGPARFQNRVDHTGPDQGPIIIERKQLRTPEDEAHPKDDGKTAPAKSTIDCKSHSSVLPKA